MKIPPTCGGPTFGWTYKQTVTRYGDTKNVMHEYLPDRGVRLVVVEVWHKRVLVEKIKMLFDETLRLLKSKIVKYPKY